MAAPDYVVVGSGLAGLSFAALMAQAGRRVRVLEAHDAAGGFGHTFEQAAGKYRFNAQLHYVWNCGPGQPVHSILRRLGLDEEVTFEPYDLDGFDRMRMPGRSLDIPADYDRLRDRLAAMFPRHTDPIDRFMGDLRGAALEIGRVGEAGAGLGRVVRALQARHVLRDRGATLQQVFDRAGVPLEAQTLLALQWPDFLLPPATTRTSTGSAGCRSRRRGLRTAWPTTSSTGSTRRRCSRPRTTSCPV